MDSVLLYEQYVALLVYWGTSQNHDNCIWVGTGSLVIKIDQGWKGKSVRIRHGPATVWGESAHLLATDPNGLGRYVQMMIPKSGDLPVSTTLLNLREIGRC